MHYNGTSSYQTIINVNNSVRMSSHDEIHPTAYYACLVKIFSTCGQNSGASEAKSEIYAFQSDTVLFILLFQNMEIKLYW